MDNTKDKEAFTDSILALMQGVKGKLTVQDASEVLLDVAIGSSFVASPSIEEAKEFLLSFFFSAVGAFAAERRELDQKK